MGVLIEAYSSRFCLKRVSDARSPESRRSLTRLQLTHKLVRPTARPRVVEINGDQNRLNPPKPTTSSFSIANAVRSTRRPATRIAGLAAIIFFACCAARSDARIAADEHAHFDPVRAIAAWYASTASAGAQNALADARAEGVVASAQSMLTTTKLDGAAGTPARVEPLRVETEIRMHRVYDSSPPEIRFSSYLAPGERRTVRGGERGVTWVTERVTSWNGVLVDRQVLSRE